VSSVYKMLYKAIEKLYENLAMKNGHLFLWLNKVLKKRDNKGI
jgi:hypothetical protein